MRKIALVTIGLVLVLFSLPMMSAQFLGGQNTITNVTGNLTPLDFNISTTQSTTNPGIGQNVTYTTSINITSRADVSFNLTNFSFSLPDNNTVVPVSGYTLTNSTGGTATPSVRTIGQGAGQYSYVTFYGLTAFSNATPAGIQNGTKNATIWTLSWIANAPVGSTKIRAILSGRTYTETWNITSANSNLTVTNASLVVSPSWFYTRIGIPTAVTFNATTLTTSGYTANYTDIESWTDLNIGTNMLEGGSGYETLSISYRGPSISTSSGSSPSATVSVVPTTTGQRWGIGILIGSIFVVAIVVVTATVLAIRKRR